MDFSLEPTLTTPGLPAEPPGRIAGRSLDEWNAAYAKVESYFHALRIRNKVLLGRLVLHVLKRAMRRAPREPQRSATELAAEEMDRIITGWFAEILLEPPTGTDQMLSTRGRLALLLADMPGKWQDQFLKPGPWPAEFVAAMRQAWLQAGPDFQVSRMTPRPLHLGALATLGNLSRLPLVKIAAAGIALALLVCLLLLIHRH